MRTEALSRIPGAFLLYPDLHADERGFLACTGDTGSVPEAGSWRWLMSRSVTGVTRGLHIRSGSGEAKLVRCSSGVIFDVIADLRPDSPAYKTWQGTWLDGASQVSLYVPAGCAHGYQVTAGPADVIYHVTGTHDPAEDLAVAWDDPELAITWPLPTAITIMSDRDKNAPSLTAVEERLCRPWL